MLGAAVGTPVHKGMKAKTEHLPPRGSEVLAHCKEESLATIRIVRRLTPTSANLDKKLSFDFQLNKGAFIHRLVINHQADNADDYLETLLVS